MKRPRILVVEDNEDNALICCTALKHFGFDPVRAEDGRSGLRLARELCPDLIILDLSLPGMSGWEVAERLRADGGTASIPIMVWSAHDSAADYLRADQLGCAGYLTKPCEIRPLLREVERALAVGGPTAPAARRLRVRLRSLRLLGLTLAAMLSLAAVAVRGRRRGGRGSRRIRPVLRPRLAPVAA